MTTHCALPAKPHAHWMTWMLHGLAILLAIGCAVGPLPAGEPASASARTTIVIFSDRPMADAAWTSLFTELRRQAAAEAQSSAALEPDPLLVRGTELVSGQLVDNPIVVKLHGDCRPPAGVQRFPSGAALGWVLREEGHISPFIHVDCTKVAQLVSPRVLWLKSGEKSPAMSGAIARVILHEWVHIAEQTDHHGREGITKRAFGGADLIPDRAPEITQTQPVAAPPVAGPAGNVNGPGSSGGSQSNSKKKDEDGMCLPTGPSLNRLVFLCGM